MLGGEQSHQLHVRVRGDEVDIGLAGTVDARMIRDEPDALPANALGYGREEHLDAGSNTGSCAGTAAQTTTRSKPEMNALMAMSIRRAGPVRFHERGFTALLRRGHVNRGRDDVGPGRRLRAVENGPSAAWLTMRRRLGVCRTPVKHRFGNEVARPLETNQRRRR